MAWFIAYFDGDPKAVLAKQPKLDRDASRALVEQLFPDSTLGAEDDGDLSILNPGTKQVFAGCYDGLRILAHDQLANDYPSKIDPRWYDPALGSTAYVHATHSVVDWFAYGLWREGQLIRALSLAPDNGVLEKIGDPLPFEAPYWSGKRPVSDDEEEAASYPLPFHPLELAEECLLQHLGFQFEGNMNDWVCDPLEIPVANFTVTKRPIWKFW